MTSEGNQVMGIGVDIKRMKLTQEELNEIFENYESHILPNIYEEYELDSEVELDGAYTIIWGIGLLVLEFTHGHIQKERTQFVRTLPTCVPMEVPPEIQKILDAVQDKTTH